ncbi:MAG: response regulator transcription factor [Polyangiaceae bacterium]
MPERVLLIEDDQELGAQIVSHLKRAGFEPLWEKQGSLTVAASHPQVALVILDLMLPGSHGLDVLKHLRKTSEVPVLVLSARNDTSDKVRALKLGADDYMTKPFWPEELIERVRARLRRPVMQRSEVQQFGELRVDFAAREVRVGERQVELTSVEFELLSGLARRPGTAVTRKWLVSNVLDPERDGGERTLDVHVSRLRKKLGTAAWVQTVWGIGYRLGEPGEE